ncbi:Ctr copper transporter family-domain-containing protein [Aspergillus aurantiobrunneus]
MDPPSLLPRMAGMDMSSAASNVSCSSDMIWNWKVIDACFLSSSWHVTTKATFAVSCIGVALLAITLEFLRRVSTEYEEGLQRQFHRYAVAQLDDPPVCGAAPSVATYRASPIQQITRAVLHVAQFGVAYILMMIAMHYNGYMVISILIGAFLGKLFFDWGQYTAVLGQGQGPPAKAAVVGQETTKCCG